MAGARNLFCTEPGQGENQGTCEGTASQKYLGHVAARVIFIFKDQLCGYVPLLCFGMVEVSTCIIEHDFLVDEGDEPIAITRGREIGHLEFEGPPI